MNYSEITHNLVVGTKIEVGDSIELQGQNVSVVVNMMEEDNSEEAFVSKAGFKYIYVPLEDGGALILSELLSISEDIAKLVVMEKEKVYIHCAYGVGRSPYMACAVIMHLGLTATEAVNFVVSKRMALHMSPWQLRSLDNLERYLNGQELLDDEPPVESTQKFLRDLANWHKAAGNYGEAEKINERILSITH